MYYSANQIIIIIIIIFITIGLANLPSDGLRFGDSDSPPHPSQMEIIQDETRREMAYL